MMKHRFWLYVGVSAIATFLTASTVRGESPEPAQAQTVETVLWSFGGPPDGADPIGGLTPDASGALYGTTELGGAYGGPNSTGLGTIFKLTPAASGYTEQVLWSFGNGRDGTLPEAGLTAQGTGTFYG